MVSYTIFQWLLFFYIYCVFGWIFESTYVSLKSRRLVNRGFLKGPMIPIYGEGAVMMVFATAPFRGNIALEFIFGMIGATALEYGVGALMESIFKVKYWDYSNQRFHIKGYICLSSSICWGVLSVLLAEVIHLPVEGFVLGLSQPVLALCVSVITVFFTADAIASAREAWDLRMILTAVTKAGEEIKELQAQLLERREELTEQLLEKKEELAEQLLEKKEEFTVQLMEKKEELTEQLAERREELSGHLSGLQSKTEELKKELAEALSHRELLSHRLNNRGIRILTRNPGATSKRFQEALDSLKENLEEKRKEKK